MAVNENPISSHVSVRRRYVRSVDMVRDVGDPNALDGYVVTPSVRDAAIRILSGLSEQSSQRAFRIVGPYGAGKSAFGLLIARLFEERGEGGPATGLLREVLDDAVAVSPWKPVIINGRRSSFIRELLHMSVRICEEMPDDAGMTLCERARTLLTSEMAIDAHVVVELVAETASVLREQTGGGLFLLIDEMGRFLEHASARVRDEDPSIFQMIAERAGGGMNRDLSIACFLHHRFIDYVSEQGGWVEAEWIRSAERYEEIAFQGSTEQSLFMLAQALEPATSHQPGIRRRAQKLYRESVNRGLFFVALGHVVEAAECLFPLHPAAVSTLCLAMRRFGQNERSVFSFLLSLEPAGFQQYIRATVYGASSWYRTPLVFDYLVMAIADNLGGAPSRRCTLAVNALANASNLPKAHRDVLKTVALIAILEPVPGLQADVGTIAWSLDIGRREAQSILDDLTDLHAVYRRPHRGDYGLWSGSSVDLSRWLDDAKMKAHVPKRIGEVSSLLAPARPIIAHRHYHSTGTLRTFEIYLWTGGRLPERTADGMIMVVPVHPDEEMEQVAQKISENFSTDPLVLACIREVTATDLKWARELALWNWVRESCEELRLDDLARAEVNERIKSAEREMSNITGLLSVAATNRKDRWLVEGKLVQIPEGGLSMELSNVCDRVFSRSPILRNELINRSKLSIAVASARMRLLELMLNSADQEGLGLVGTPPERTIYLSLFRETGMHRVTPDGVARFTQPVADDLYGWQPAWDRIAELLDTGKNLNFSTMLDVLAAPPYGLRTAPALLLVSAYMLANKDRIAIMERNTFQPDLTGAHFMRLSKNPRNFVLRSLREDESESGLVEALSEGLHLLGECGPTVKEVSERLYSWYNGLVPYSLKTKTVSETAIAVRHSLGKAADPVQLLYHDLPVACGFTQNPVDVDQFVKKLNSALLELNDAISQLRTYAINAAVRAFGVSDLNALQSRVREECGPYQQYLGDHRLSVFVDRMMNSNLPPDTWLDGVAGHLTGSRPSSWTDEMPDKFDFEIRSMAGTLARWLTLFRPERAADFSLRPVHVIGVDGREEIVIVRSEQQNPDIATRLDAVRDVLGTGPGTMEILGQLLIECTEERIAQNSETDKILA